MIAFNYFKEESQILKYHFGGCLCLPGHDVIRNFALLDQLGHYRGKIAELALCLFCCASIQYFI